MHIAEVGCGTGWLAERLSKFGNYIGYDLSHAAIKMAKSRSSSYKFEVTDLENEVFPENKYDVIVIVDAIAYFKDQDLIIRKLYKSLKPNGHLILTTVNPFVYKRMDIGPPGKGQTRNWLPRSRLHFLLRKNQFKIKKSTTISPDGHKGILRIINSKKLTFGMDKYLYGLKEKLGLGQYRIVHAIRN